MTIIEYWKEEYRYGTDDIEEVIEREEEALNLLDTNIEAFLDWCADEGIEYVEADMAMWEASFK